MGITRGGKGKADDGVHLCYGLWTWMDGWMSTTRARHRFQSYHHHHPFSDRLLITAMHIQLLMLHQTSSSDNTEIEMN
jgi:hypothetical protein